MALRRYYDSVYKVETVSVVLEEDSHTVDHTISYYYHKDHIVGNGFRYIADENIYVIEEIITDDVEEVLLPIVYSLLGADLIASFVIYMVLADKNKKKVLAGTVDVDKAEEPMTEEPMSEELAVE
jgi:hypothetical protein